MNAKKKCYFHSEKNQTVWILVENIYSEILSNWRLKNFFLLEPLLQSLISFLYLSLLNKFYWQNFEKFDHFFPYLINRIDNFSNWYFHFFAKINNKKLVKTVNANKLLHDSIALHSFIRKCFWLSWKNSYYFCVNNSPYIAKNTFYLFISSFFKTF